MTNEAAERLPVKGLPPDLSSGVTMTPWECEQKVAAERKATVERIRAAAIQVDVASHGELSMHDLDAILDAEAAR